ncbi:hypothetical protein EW026_g5712 [Hermanssonia centrifuga]|uniref:Glycosyl hydrolase family 13 catalytic domain-containing protein n=1 Tax=Hermanssonia centrifuga TaxID=98765 RepID=A0A4S4KDE2_9APHY|nr:hypothetical protein EW026_g5712 [Hermanssonia centrifuga]
MISKVENLPNAPITDPTSEYQSASLLFTNGPNVHSYIKEMNEKVLSHYDLMTVGETPLTHHPEDIAAYVLPTNKELHMVFHFEQMDLDGDGDSLIQKPRQFTKLKALIEKWQQFNREDGFWNTIYLENHDHARSVSRFGNDSDEWRVLSAKLLAIMQTTQSGTLFVYQGEEIGMKNFPKSWGLDEYKDVATHNFWNQTKAARERISGGKPVHMSDLLDNFQKKARDHARTPIQWENAPHGGFTTGTPWMRVNDDYPETNVAIQVGDPNSVLSFWKKALALRKEHEVMVHYLQLSYYLSLSLILCVFKVYGDFTLHFAHHEQLFAYSRTLDNMKAIVVMNFSTGEINFDSQELGLCGARLALNNYEVEDRPFKDNILRGYEGRIYIAGVD